MWKYLFSYEKNKIKQKYTLNKDSAFSLGSIAEKKKTPWRHKRLPTLDTRSIVLFLLSVWDPCLILIGGEHGGGLQSYRENYSHTGWCCVTGRNNAGGRRDVSLQLTSAVPPCLSLWQFIQWQLNFSSTSESAWGFQLRWRVTGAIFVPLRTDFLDTALDARLASSVSPRGTIRDVQKGFVENEKCASSSQPKCLENKQQKWKWKVCFCDTLKLKKINKKNFPGETSQWERSRVLQLDVQRGHCWC